MEEIREFWEQVMKDEEVGIQHRLKASELCLKLKESFDEDKVVVIFGEEEV